MHLHVTEHQAQSKICPCGARTTAVFPESVKGPVQIGDTLRAFTVLLGQHHVAKDRISEIIESLFGIAVSDTSIQKYEEQADKNLKVLHTQLYDHIARADVKHADETGVRVGGSTHWLHTLSTSWLTYLWYSPKRKCALTGLNGKLVHDNFTSYECLADVEHIYCNAHHLRELCAVFEQDNEAWAYHMHQLLREMCHATHLYGSLANKQISAFKDAYDRLVTQGITYHERLDPLARSDKKKQRGRLKRRRGHNLALRFRIKREGILMFLNDPSVPFTNNQAERDLRPVKIQQKVSGCFRTSSGAERYAAIRSFVSTLRKLGLDVWTWLQKAIKQPILWHDIQLALCSTYRALPAPSSPAL